MDFFEKTKRGRGKVKHAILDRYFKAWIAILCQTTEWQTPVLYIDGFAGPGTYSPSDGPEQPGSPVVVYQAVTDHLSLPNFKKNCNKVELIFVEKDRKKAEQLEAILTDLERKKTDSVKETVRFRVVNEEFAIFLEHILEPENMDYVHSPMFVFADPFGYKEIPMYTLKKLMERGSGRWLPTEVFITVMDSFARRFISDSRKSSSINALMGYDNWQNLSKDGLSSDERREQFIELYISNLKTDIIGAETLKFAMRNNINCHIYHLIFLTCHIKGVKEMKKAMWKQSQSREEMTFSEWVENKSVQNEENILNKSPDKIALLLEKRIRAMFSGKRVSGDDIEYFIWIDTPYLPCKPQLKKLLKDCAVNKERSFEKIIYFFGSPNSSGSPSKLPLKQMILSPLKQNSASTSQSPTKQNSASTSKNQLKQLKLCFE